MITVYEFESSDGSGSCTITTCYYYPELNMFFKAVRRSVASLGTVSQTHKQTDTHTHTHTYKFIYFIYKNRNVLGCKSTLKARLPKELSAYVQLSADRGQRSSNRFRGDM